MSTALISQPKKGRSTIVEEYAPAGRKEAAPPPLTAAEIVERRAAYSKYGRGDRVAVKSVKDKKLRGNLKALENKYKEFTLQAKDAEMLLQEERGIIETEGMERTFKLTQEELKKDVDIATAQKGFELKLPTFGPYYIDYTRNGRYLLIGGRKGHVAAFDWREGKLLSEVHHRETVRDVKWLHNESFYAVSQKKYVYIYDTHGVEIHKLDKHIEAIHMEFLPFHFLLATIGNSGWLKYQDTSTGQLVSEMSTHLPTATSMTQNPHNAIIHLGHAKGIVSLWSPATTTPLVKMLTNKGPVTSLSVDRSGRYMVTSGQDKKLSVWDIRMYKEVYHYWSPLPASSIHISDTGLVGVGWGSHVTVWASVWQKRQKQPYMTHHCPGSQINDVRFCPFEDILGYGHKEGLGSLIIPGAGEANFDALEVNPYETKKEKRENEVRMLLNKLKPEMISLDPDHIGTIDRRTAEVRTQVTAEGAGGNAEAISKKKDDGKDKFKARGRNSAAKRYARKMRKKNIMDERRFRYETERDDKQRAKAGVPSQKEELGPALARFVRKG